MCLKLLMSMKFKKGIINTVIFLFFVCLTFFIVFKDNNISEIFGIILHADIKFIFLAIGFMSFFVIAEGINISRTLKLLNCKISFWAGIKYALVGFFFSSVTPSASGGDPMQLYYMKKDDLPLGHSALALLTEFSSFQFVTIIMAIIGFMTSYKYLETSIGNIKYLLLVGVVINAGILAIILLTIFSDSLIINLVNFISKLLEKLHFKKVNVFKEKCLLQISDYKAGANLLMKNKIVLLKIVSTTIVQVILYHSIPFMIYLSFNLTRSRFFPIFSASIRALHICFCTSSSWRRWS